MKQTRIKALEILWDIVKEWMAETLLKHKGITEDLGGGLYTFGSYEMDVHSPGGDIDALIVVPLYIEWERDFFGSLS